MHILGICNGTPNGNSEISLKAALLAAQSSSPITISTSIVHIPSVSIPPNPKPLATSIDISLGANKSMLDGTITSLTTSIPDDRQVLLDALLDADAYIFSTPIYSHSPPGHLKAVFDKICGPFNDAALVHRILQAQRLNPDDPNFKDIHVDPRILKPRVAAFMAIGGSSTSDQITMALPILHTLIYSLHVKVIDQVVFLGVGTPGSIISRHSGAYMNRATQLGRNLASQLGKPFYEAIYLGEEHPNACPYCHLTKVDLFITGDSHNGDRSRKNEIGCIACGARGVLFMNEEGDIVPRWDEDCRVSSITWVGKEVHFEDIQIGGSEEKAEIDGMEGFEAEMEKWIGLQVEKVKVAGDKAC